MGNSKRGGLKDFLEEISYLVVLREMIVSIKKKVVNGRQICLPEIDAPGSKFHVLQFHEPGEFTLEVLQIKTISPLIMV